MSQMNLRGLLTSPSRSTGVQAAGAYCDALARHF